MNIFLIYLETYLLLCYNINVENSEVLGQQREHSRSSPTGNKNKHRCYLYW